MDSSDLSLSAKILIAEDAADLREALVEMLSELDYNVKAAQDGYEAVAMFQEFDPDIAILDMNMPMRNGSDVCAVIRQTSNIPVIMYTSADDVAKVNGAIEKGATDFVLKTTGIDELAARVESHLMHGRSPIKQLQVQPPSNITPLLPSVHISTGSRKPIKSFTVIIDPNEKSRSAITKVLVRLNQDYIEVETAEEGHLAIERHDPDIVITEWQLPDMDAFKMFTELKRARNAKKLVQIVMSNRLRPEAHRKAKFIGINSFLDKPLDGGKVEIVVSEGVKTAIRSLKQTV